LVPTSAHPEGVHPYVAEQEQQLALKKLAAEEMYRRLNFAEGGRNARSEDQQGRLEMNTKLSAINAQAKILADQKKSPAYIMMNPSQRKEIDDRLAALNQMALQVAAVPSQTPSGIAQAPQVSVPVPTSSATAPKATQRPDGNYYSPSQNKTYVYQGGVPVKVVDGKL
jgi:hypothetical protein